MRRNLSREVPFMTRLTYTLLASGALSLAFAAPAAADCDRERTGNAVVGAVVGGVLGGVIGNELSDDDHHYRGYRGYRGRGYRRGYRRGYYHGYKGDNDGEVLAGALLGALAGGAIGASATDCDDRPTVVGPYGVVPNDDPFRRGQVTRSGEYGWGDSTSGQYGYQQPVYGQQVGYPQTGYPQQPVTRQPAPQQPVYRQAPAEECRIVYAETQFPDGRIEREPVNVCREGPNGSWQRVESELYGG